MPQLNAPVTKLLSVWDQLPERYQSFIRFCIVGAIAAAVHYGIYYLLLLVGCPVNPAYIAGYIVSFVGNYFATSYFTFHSKPSWGHFVGFAGSHALNFVLHIVLLNFFLWLLPLVLGTGEHFNELIAPILVMTVAMVIQYTILNMVFKDRKPCGGEVMLSFDIEEWDLPLEHGVEYDPLTQGMEVSAFGANRILDCLKACGEIRATFFCTTNFANHAPEVIQRIVAEGHEVAAHGCDHFKPQASDVAESKRMLEQLTGQTILGYRQPRMFPVDIKEQVKQGYLYNASLNPAFIPGRYMHLNTPRTYFKEEGLLQIPASVSPWLRIPMFWLALHNFPLWLYKGLAHRILRHDGYFNTYFHPWEFYELNELKALRIPLIIRHHAGSDMYERLKAVITDLQQQGCTFISYSDFAQRKK